MSESLKRTYRLHDPVSSEVAKTLAAYDALTQQLLVNRGITDAETAETFLNPDYDNHLHDPFLLTDMEQAVERILAAIEKEEQIVIYSDYDCDGIPGGVILHDFFKAIGYEHFTNYIPHRHHEGYGFTAENAAKLAKEGAALIITIDCGTVDHAAVEVANKAGVDVIVTDHHEPSDTLPAALAVINPKRADAYPFTGLCGAGVIFKVVQATIIRGKEKGVIDLTEGWEKWWLDMVGIATIADMVPLTDENRVLAHYGLQVLRKSRRPGLQHLLRKAGGNQRFLTEDDIGFTIGPRVNAASRMDTPEDAFHMLATRDEGEAGERVRHLEKLNNERKGVVAGMVKEAKKRIAGMDADMSVIVIGNPEWKPSLVGLVASSLSEEYVAPSFVWGRDGKGVLKGSCRSAGAVSVVDIMRAADDALLGYGGHHAAGGFSVDDTGVHTLHQALHDAYHEVVKSEETHIPETLIDTNLTLSAVDNALIRTLSSLAPYGMGNDKPVFQFQDVVPQQVAVFGKTKNHTKLTFHLEDGMLEAIAFFKTPEQFDIVPEVDTAHTLIAHVEESFFRGRKQIRLRIIDIL